MRVAQVIVIGAGIGGLACALRLAAAGEAVTVIDRAPEVGGKMRTLPSVAGPVDAGPTVLTMRPVFEDLFAAAGARLDDHVTLRPSPMLARHWWRDGSSLDLHADRDASIAAIGAFAGPRAAAQYATFSARAQALFEAFDAPMMQAADPALGRLAATVLRRPGVLRAMAPLSTLAGRLARDFDDPRLRQLFGRYATYVGGRPDAAPGLLALVAHSEAMGVWAVEGGMHALAVAIRDLARARGARFHLGTEARRIETQGGRVVAVHTSDGRMACDAAVFNGDPRALTMGLLGPSAQRAIPAAPLAKRSLSAHVWAFAARPSPVPLSHHNVFFGADPDDEFGPLARGEMPVDPTLYVCAQDRSTGTPTGPERFEIIMNGPPCEGPQPASQGEIDQCRTRVFGTLARFGLTFDGAPPDRALTTPQGFAALFPGSAGSLYGQSPHGLTAALARPRARTAVPGLFLVGGGAHPGAGVPMATLSARHAAETMLAARTSTSPSRPTAMPGGMSTV
ncbi:MAG: 1-hydroxycarotenoid 3,4-desaturase CrtD [Shimia sp.]